MLRKIVLISKCVTLGIISQKIFSGTQKNNFSNTETTIQAYFTEHCP